MPPVRPQEIPFAMQAIRDCAPLFGEPQGNLFDSPAVDALVTLVSNGNDEISDVLFDEFDRLSDTLTTRNRAPIVQLPTSLFDCLGAVLGRLSPNVRTAIVAINTDLTDDAVQYVGTEEPVHHPGDAFDDCLLAFTETIVESLTQPPVSDNPFYTDDDEDADIDVNDEEKNYRVIWDFRNRRLEITEVTVRTVRQETSQVIAVVTGR